MSLNDAIQSEADYLCGQDSRDEEVNDLIRALAAVREKIQVAERKAAEVQPLTRREQDLVACIAELNAEINKLRSSAEARNKTISDLNSKVNMLDAELEELEGDYSNLRADNNNLLDKIRRLKIIIEGGTDWYECIGTDKHGMEFRHPDGRFVECLGDTKAAVIDRALEQIK